MGLFVMMKGDIHWMIGKKARRKAKKGRNQKIKRENKKKKNNRVWILVKIKEQRREELQEIILDIRSNQELLKISQKTVFPQILKL